MKLKPPIAISGLSLLIILGGFNFVSASTKLFYYEDCGSTNYVYNGFWPAQSFTPDQDATNVNQVELLIGKESGFTATTTFRIATSTNNWSNPICTADISASSLDLSTAWVSIDTTLCGLSLTSGTEYWIMLGNTSEALSMLFLDNTSGAYSGGALKGSGNQGASYGFDYPASDMCFRIYGDGGGISESTTTEASSTTLITDTRVYPFIFFMQLLLFFGAFILMLRT